MRKQKKGKESKALTPQTQESRLAKVFQEFTCDESIGVLNALDEAMQELETKKEALDYNLGDDASDQFLVSEELQPKFSSAQGAHLFTTADVTNALRREETNQPAKEVENTEPQVMQRGLRSRIRRGKEKRKSKEKRVEMEAGIFGTTSNPSKWSLSHYLQSVASTREKRVVAVSAWILALIGLVISLVFVTKDFIQSQKELASTIRYVDSDRLQLPSIWICTVDTRVPPFMDQPTNEHKGQPLLWIDFFRGSSSKFNLTYPDTKQLKQLQVVSVNILGQRCKAQESMDPQLFQEENTRKPECFHCLAISRTPAIEVAKKDTVNNENLNQNGRFGGAVDHAALRISQHSIMSGCRTSRFGLAGNVFRFFRDEIKRHHVQLKQRGILDFGLFDPANYSHDALLWPQYRRGYRNGTLDYVVYDVVDMFCNTYLFSDYFYSSTSEDIKFKFNSTFYRWERDGNGPYYPPNFSDFYTELSQSNLLINDNGRIGTEKFENISIYTSRGLQVMTNHSRVGGADTIATLEPNNMASVRLSRNLIQDRESFGAKVFRTTVRSADVRAVNYVYFLDLSFDSFLTRVVSDQLRVSWPAFIADFFGLTSLFLDVSVYTLIVSPLIVRARKKALVARKMRLRGPAAL